MTYFCAKIAGLLVFDNHYSTDPFFNLALEEYLFKELEEDVLMLWRNERSIIVGKHQNALAEINRPYVLEHGIPVIRRLSGGGTVFHDPGNLNFSFLRTGERSKLVDFSRFVGPVIKALGEMGIKAHQGKRNDIRVGHKKISGNAEHTFRSRVLHHGTLLFSSELGMLMEALRVNPLKYTDKAIKSVQARVMNLSELLEGVSLAEFRQKLFESLCRQMEAVEPFELRPAVIGYVEKLASEKYRTWEWNYAYGPVYELHRSLHYMGKEYEFSMQVRKGKIVSVKSKEAALADNLAPYLVGRHHRPEELISTVKDPELAAIISGLY